MLQTCKTTKQLHLFNNFNKSTFNPLLKYKKERIPLSEIRSFHIRLSLTTIHPRNMVDANRGQSLGVVKASLFFEHNIK